MIKQHFPMFSVVATALPLMLGDGALFIMSLVAVIGAIPLIYGPDVDQVVEAVVARRDNRD